MTALAHTSAATGSTTDRLRTLLRADAALCAVTGLLAAAAAPAVADLLGPDVSTTVVRVVGIALVAYALDLAVTSRAAQRWQRPAVLFAGLGNLAWVAATLVLLAVGAFSAVGAGVAVAVGAVVGGLGLLQLRAARR
jgi:hypothetical protein